MTCKNRRSEPERQEAWLIVFWWEKNIHRVPFQTLHPLQHFVNHENLVFLCGRTQQTYWSIALGFFHRLNIRSTRFTSLSNSDLVPVHMYMHSGAVLFWQWWQQTAGTHDDTEIRLCSELLIASHDLVKILFLRHLNYTYNRFMISTLSANMHTHKYMKELSGSTFNS